MHERKACRFRSELQRPVESGIAAAENDEPFAVKFGCIAHAIVDGGAFEDIGALHPQPARLKGTHATGDHDCARIEGGAESCAHEKAPVLPLLQLDYFLAQMKLRV